MGESSSAIKDCVLKAHNCYFHKEYTRTVAILQKLKERLGEGYVAKVLSEIFECDENVFYIALENNILISNALIVICEGKLDNQKWYEIMEDLLRQLDILEGIRIAYPVPLSIHLNAVYNTLWWGWTMPHALQQDKSHMKSCIQAAIHGCYRVLEDCKAGLLRTRLDENEDKLLVLTKKLCPQLVHFSGTEAVQTLETILLIVHVLIGACPTERTYRKCGDILESVLGLRNEIRELVMRSKRSNATRTLLRFGLYEDINGAVHKCDAAFVMDIVVLTCSLCYFLAKSHDTSISVLDMGMTGGNLNLSFLCNFLYALTYYHMNELEASSLYVKKLEHIPMDEEARTRYHLLHGAILVKKGNYLEGLGQLLMAREKQRSRDLQAVTLFHIAQVYEVLERIRPHSTSEQTDVSGRERPSFYDVPRDGHLAALRQLADVLRNKEALHRNDGMSYDLQYRILSLVYPKPEVNLTLALVLLADRLMNDGEMHAASELYSELLSAQDLCQHRTLLRPLPHVSVLHHNAVTLYLRCGNLEQAQAVCNRALHLFWRQENSSFGRDLEQNLLRLEQDLVAMILQSHIHRLTGDDKNESSMLDKCLNVIYNFKVRYKSEDDKVGEEETRALELLDLLAARLHVQKANVYHNRGFGFVTDALHEVREAIYCNPDDEDAVQLYRALLKDAQLDIPHRQRSNKMLSVADIESMALRYILEIRLVSVNDVTEKDKVDPFQDSDVDLFDEWI